MASRRATGRAKRQRQVKPVKNGPARHCIRDPNRPPVCNNKKGRKNCSLCKDFQEIRRKANNRRLSRISCLNRNNRRRALLAEVETNKLSLDQAGAALDWQLAEKAALQVQIEEMLELLANLRAMRYPGGNE